MLDILDCGHAPSAHSSLTTGYGTDREGKRHCYACCAANERARMIETGAATLYLVRDPAPATGTGRGNYSVTDWSGALRFPCLGGVSVSSRGGGFGSKRYDADFIGPDGYIWHAVNRGDNEIARCKRTKKKAALAR